MTTQLICNRCGEYEQDCLCEPPVECEKCKKYAVELSALQKENAELKDANRRANAAIGDTSNELQEIINSLRTQNRELRDMCKVKDEVLQQAVLTFRYQANTLRGFDQGMMQGWLNLAEKCDKALALQPEK